MKYLSTILMSVLFSAAFAQMPDSIVFREGEIFDMTFSKINSNRLYVQGEKITKILYPEGTFVVDTSDDLTEQGSDSVYLKPAFDDVITLYVTTNKNHHFSIHAKGDDSLGKTVKMVPFVAKKVVPKRKISHQAKKKPEIRKRANSSVNAIIEAMIAKNTPENMGVVKPSPRTFQLEKSIRMKAIKAYKGRDFSAYTYEIKNTANTPVQLKNDYFVKNKQVKAIHLSKKTLQPNESANLYVVSQDAKRSVA